MRPKSATSSTVLFPPTIVSNNNVYMTAVLYKFLSAVFPLTQADQPVLTALHSKKNISIFYKLGGTLYSTIAKYSLDKKMSCDQIPTDAIEKRIS